jgi:hypothetical protein
MTFIDPSLESATASWWDRATSLKAADKVRRNVNEWRQNYVVRREKDVLKDRLTEKHISTSPIGVKQQELDIYTYYENMFMKTMKTFKKLNEASENLMTRKRRKETFNILMACMTSMRMSLIHPIVPKGREITIKFSPSRRKNKKVSNL